MGFSVAFDNDGVVLTYRVENPRCSVPGRRVEHRPQIKEEHSSDTTAIHLVLLVFLWLRDLDVRTNDPQANRSSGGTDKQQPTTTDTVDEP